MAVIGTIAIAATEGAVVIMIIVVTVGFVSIMGTPAGHCGHCGHRGRLVVSSTFLRAAWAHGDCGNCGHRSHCMCCAWLSYFLGMVICDNEFVTKENRILNQGFYARCGHFGHRGHFGHYRHRGHPRYCYNCQYDGHFGHRGH